MNITAVLKHLTVATLIVSLMLVATGCEDDDESGVSLKNIGDNDPNVVLCMGDSITMGDGRGGAPYPQRLGSMTGKRVINSGAGGEHSTGGAGRIGSALRTHKPGVVLILYGANDLINGRDPNGVVGNLRSMINSARANQTVPVIATLTPMSSSYKIWSGSVKALNVKIRAMASAEKVRLVDLERQLSDDPDAFLHDGLHPNDVGTHLIARAFSKAL